MFLSNCKESRKSRPTMTAHLNVELLEDRVVPSGSPLDLTTAGAQGSIGSAIFEEGSTQPAGSGVIDSFVRIHALGGEAQEQGYNTDARPLQYNENSSPTFTRSLKLSDVPILKVNGDNYRVFLLDINQKSSAPLVSLDQLQIFLGNSGNLTGYDPATRQLPGLTAVYDMTPGGSGDWVVLNARNSHGSGSSDMVLLVPDSLFIGTAGDPYVYLFSRFGDHYGTNGGYEEWAVSTASGSTGGTGGGTGGTGGVPAPSSLSGFVFDTTSSTAVPVAGVMVELTGFDSAGNQVTLFAVTNASGFYFFDDLPAGTYTLTEVPPSRDSASGTTVGSVGGTGTTDTVSSIDLGSGLNAINYDFYLVFNNNNPPPGTLPTS